MPLDKLPICYGRQRPAKCLEKYQASARAGDDAFVKKHCQPNESETLREVSKVHRKSVALTLEEYRTLHPVRDLAMANAYLSGAYTMAEIGKFFAVHYMTVSRAVRKI